MNEYPLHSYSHKLANNTIIWWRQGFLCKWYPSYKASSWSNMFPFQQVNIIYHLGWNFTLNHFQGQFLVLSDSFRLTLLRYAAPLLLECPWQEGSRRNQNRGFLGETLQICWSAKDLGFRRKFEQVKLFNLESLMNNSTLHKNKQLPCVSYQINKLYIWLQKRSCYPKNKMAYLLRKYDLCF